MNEHKVFFPAIVVTDHKRLATVQFMVLFGLELTKI